MQHESPTQNTSRLSKIWGAIKAGFAALRNTISAIFGKWFGTKKSVHVPEQQQERQDTPVEKPTEPETVVVPETTSTQAPQKPVEDDDTRRRRERAELKEKALISIRRANELLGAKLPFDSSIREANRTLQDADERIRHMQEQIVILETFCDEGSSYDIGDAKWILTQLNENCTIIEKKLRDKLGTVEEYHANKEDRLKTFQKIMAGEETSSKIDSNSALGKAVESARQQFKEARVKATQPPELEPKVAAQKTEKEANAQKEKEKPAEVTITPPVVPLKTVEQPVVTVKTPEQECIEEIKALVKQVDNELDQLGSMSFNELQDFKETLLADQKQYQRPIDTLKEIIRNNECLIPSILSLTIRNKLKYSSDKFMQKVIEFKESPNQLVLAYYAKEVEKAVNVISTLRDAMLAVNRAKEIMTKSGSEDMTEQVSNVESAIKAVLDETNFEEINKPRLPALEVAYQVLHESLKKIEAANPGKFSKPGP